MENKQNKIQNIDEKSFRSTLKNISKEHFDGHTDFIKLTPEQKLQWLSSAAQFYFEIKK